MKHAIPLFIMVSLFLAACQDHIPSKKEDNEKIVRTYFDEVWNKGQLQVLDTLLSPDYVNHTPSTPNPPKGPDGLKPIVAAIRKGFPNLHYEIKDVIVTPDKAVVRVVMTGTHTDTLFGIAPTGKHIEVNQINIEKIRNGKITEHWRVTDEFSLMKQLGVVK